MDNNTLSHHGIKGMKWGVRRTPAQLGHKTMSKKKLKSAKDTIEKIKKSIAKSKKASEAKKAKKLAAEELKKKQKTELTKEEILKSRSAKKLFENAHLFDDKELNAAYNRLNTERNIKNLISSDADNGKQKAKKYADFTNTTSDVIEGSTRLYNNVAKVMNTFYKTDLPKVK